MSKEPGALHLDLTDIPQMPSKTVVFVPEFRCAALIVEGDHTFRRAAQVGHDEADAGIQFNEPKGADRR